jgi:DNA polymerase-4
LRIRFDDSSRITRSHTLAQATAHTQTVLVVARQLLASVDEMIAERGVTLVGVSVSNLDDDRAVQLSLPFDEHCSMTIDAAVDRVRDRFGSAALTRAVLVGHDPGLTVPLLPD